MSFTFLLVTPSEPSNGTSLFRAVYLAPKSLIFAVCVGLFAGMSPSLLAQENVLLQSPGITLNLPPGIASESVQINYFMLGPFGGYGGYVTRERGRVPYDVPWLRNREARDHNAGNIGSTIASLSAPRTSPAAWKNLPGLRRSNFWSRDRDKI